MTDTQYERNWQEDAAHENGNYMCTCGQCGCQFIGHKRRVQCKVCAGSANVDTPTPDTPAVPEPVAWQWKHPRWTGGEWCITENTSRNTKGAEYRALYPEAQMQALADLLAECEADREALMQKDARWIAAASYGDGSPMFTPERLEKSIVALLDRATTAEAALESARKVIENLLDATHGRTEDLRAARQWLSANPKETKG